MRRAAYLVFRKLGARWLVAVISWFVCLFYFIFQTASRSESMRFYQSLFPDRSHVFHLSCAWKQFRGFSLKFADRMSLSRPERITYEIDGAREDVDAILSAGTGCMLVMSHVGDWEVAARLLHGKGRRLMLYMGVRRGEHVESVQKEELRKDGVDLVATVEGEVSPLAILEGIECLRNGGLVGMSGDRTWPGSSQEGAARRPLLDGTVLLPRIPYVMAAVAGVPVYFFFGFKIGPGRYRVTLSRAFRIPAARAERQAAVDQTLTAYSGMLETAAREYPFQWYHFEPFITRS